MCLVMTQPYRFQREGENIEMFAMWVEALFRSLFILESLLCQLPCNMFISAVSRSDFSHCYFSYLKKGKKASCYYDSFFGRTLISLVPIRVSHHDILASSCPLQSHRHGLLSCQHVCSALPNNPSKICSVSGMQG